MNNRDTLPGRGMSEFMYSLIGNGGALLCVLAVGAAAYFLIFGAG